MCVYLSRTVIVDRGEGGGDGGGEGGMEIVMISESVVHYSLFNVSRQRSLHCMYVSHTMHYHIYIGYRYYNLSSHYLTSIFFSCLNSLSVLFSYLSLTVSATVHLLH